MVAPRPAADPVRLCYIAGAGRSGSTILNILLGNHPEAVNVGELRQLARVIHNRELCSCGVEVARCPWWSRVQAGWSRGAVAEPLDALFALQQRFERIRSALRGGRKVDAETFAEYSLLTRSLLEEIRREAGGRIIVDSSKTPARAMALARVEGIDLRVIHLVRDPRGYAWSLAKSFARDQQTGLEKEVPSRGAVGAAVSWIFANLQASRLVGQLGSRRALTVRYEDLVEFPGRTLEQIGSLLDSKFTSLVQALKMSGEAGLELKVGHTLAGNRLRMRSNLKLRPDLEWRQRMLPRDRWRISMLAGWLMKKYDYEP